MKTSHQHPFCAPLLVALLGLISGCTGTSEPLGFCDLVRTTESGEAYMTVQDFCGYRHLGCPWTTAELEAQHDSCEVPDFNYDRCEFKRFSGCGVIQYEHRYDESYYFLLSYDADTRELIGVISATDSPRWCGSVFEDEVTIGRIGPLLPSSPNICGEVEETSCCTPAAE